MPSPLIAIPLLGGLLTGVLGAFGHRAQAAGLPVGLVVTLALLLAVVVAGGLLTGRSLGAVLAFLGWLAVQVVLLPPRTEGDNVLPGTWVTYAFLVGGLVLGAAACTWPYGASAARAQGRRHPRYSARPGAPTSPG